MARRETPSIKLALEDEEALLVFAQMVEFIRKDGLTPEEKALGWAVVSEMAVKIQREI